MIVPVIAFLAAGAAALYWGRPAMRCIVAIAIILAPLRGGLLAVAGDANLSNSSLAINALVPALIAALAIVILFRLRPRPSDFPTPLLVGFGLIVAVCVFNFIFQEVGLKLYGVGVAQYLAYPVMALAAWPLYEKGDAVRVGRLFILMGAVVALTVFLQALGVGGFIQSAGAVVEGLAANRYAGITGSYLHTSAFLGITIVLLYGELSRLEDLRSRLLGTALLATLMSAEILTFSRSGIVISAIGAVIFLVLSSGKRAIFTAMLVPAIAIALAVGAIGGVAPNAVGERVGSGLSPSGDPGNDLRVESFSQAIDRFKDAPVGRKVVGEGLASTGNARKLVKGDVIAVESYYLKLLLETGIIGLIVLGSFLVWAAIIFALSLWRAVDPVVIAIGAAGLGLSLYNAIYPALETQILALAWWMLFMLCLALRREASEQPRDEPATSGSEPAQVAAV